MRERGILTDDQRLLKEYFFHRGMEVLRPVNYMIADTYPIVKRDKMSPQHDPVVAEEFEKASKRARFLLYEQRNLVQEKWLPRYEIMHSGGTFKETPDWAELKSLIVDGCLDRLAEVLIAISPVIVAKEYVDGLQQAIQRVTEVEKKNMEAYLRSFYVIRKSGVPTIAEEYGV